MTKEEDESDILWRAIKAVLPDPVARVEFADALEQDENAYLDRVAMRYNATEKDCACVVHTGPCWLYHQRIMLRHNTDIIRRGGQLAASAFSREEAARYAELRSELERLERKRTNAH